MHTYRKAENGGWQVGYHAPNAAFVHVQLGPTFGLECEAAAFASFLNGGRYNPYEIEALFRVEPAIEADDITYPRPQGMDYPQEATQRHK